MLEISVTMRSPREINFIVIVCTCQKDTELVAFFIYFKVSNGTRLATGKLRAAYLCFRKCPEKGEGVGEGSGAQV